MKSVRIRCFSGPFFPRFGLNKDKYGVSLRIQSKCEKIWTRSAPNKDAFYALKCPQNGQIHAKIIPQIMEKFWRVFDHSMNTRLYGLKKRPRSEVA